jgi:serine/threonine protein kinase
MVGRYALYGEIAKGGMATVYFGRLHGAVGFSRTVAIKRLHPHYTSDSEFVSMFVDEARLAARVQHPNVVSTLDVIAKDGELMLVMEYIQGESLSRLMSSSRNRNERIPWRITAAIINSILSGLHGAHEAKNERGEPLGIVHRDMSPQNVLVGADGVVRVFDFGVAKASGRAQDTRKGQFKGKLAYAAPEQLAGQPIDRRVDIYAASVVLWEMVANRRMFKADDEMQLYAAVREGRIEPPSHVVSDIPAGLEAIVMRGLATDPAYRFATAREMAIALEEVMPHASAREVAEWVGRVAKSKLDERSRRIEEIETNTPVMVSDSGVRDLPTLVRTSSPPPSSISTSGIVPAMTAPLAAPAPRKRSRAWLVIAVLLIAGSAAGGVVLATRSTGEPSFVEEPQTGGKKHKEKKDEKTSEEPIEQAASENVEPSKPIEPEPAKPVPTAKVAAPKAAPVAPSKASATQTIAAPPPPPAANCNPPFTIDPDGIRHPKPECM